MTEYKELLGLFSKRLSEHVADLQHKKPVELYGPEAYILELGGKRLRPLLALIACELFGKDPREAIDAALSVELFHNFSLIHDDILDQAPLRRNHPTVHTKWNTNIAILSGDAVLVKAFQALGTYEAETARKLTNIFSKTAIEVCEGQQLDMNFENMDSVSVDDYIHMITYKTAVLLGCSLQMGAIIAKTSPADQEHLYEFGKHLGISFQLLDDLLDAFAENPEKFGKKTGGDILANKKTFLTLNALENANSAQSEEIRKVLAMEASDDKIKKMLSLYKTLRAEKHCREEADKHTRIALQHLEKLSARESEKTKLRTFALNLLNREL
ncbi:MAG: polyprenyl synthetase family protein [Bacteroidia bacterium]|nr:polyprenyl synthetase family protein [Bacteroidia bacterium]